MKNIYFAQFYIRHNGKFTELLGSEGVMTLDGRQGELKHLKVISLQVLRLRAVQPLICGYSVHYGTYSNNRIIRQLRSL